jgi:hypothetical protein
MYVNVKNLGTIATPLTSMQAGGIAIDVDPGETATIDNPAMTLATFGDDPGFAEEFAEDLSELADTIRDVIEQYRDRVDAQGEGDDEDAAEAGEVYCSIENIGPHTVRFILGADNTNERHLGAGETFEGNAPGYITIRELEVGSEPTFREGGA